MPDTPVAKVSLDAARAEWVRRAGLADPVPGTPGELVARTGWLRTLGGVDPYLALLARRPGLTLGDVDEAVADGDLCVTPAVRNCIHVVPGSQRSAALAEAAEKWERRAARDAQRAGIEDGELDAVAAAVIAVLDRPSSTDEIRAALPDGAVRSLGDEGRTAGISSTLPPALRRLEFADRVRRHPVDDRLDTERHRWALNPEPAPDQRPSIERRAELVGELARNAGPVTVNEIAAWMATSMRDTVAAIAEAGLVEVDLENHDRGWMAPEQLEELLRAGPIEASSVRLLGFEDLALVTHTPAAWFAPRHHQLRLPVWGKGEHTLGGANHVAMRTVLVGAHMAGFWAWDPDSRAVEIGLLETTDAATAQALGETAEATTLFLRDGFGHARMTSIDGESTERARLEALRSMVG